MASDPRAQRKPGEGGDLLAPGALALASFLLLAASFLPGGGAEWVYVLVTPLFPVLLIWLSMGRVRPVRRLSRGVLLVLGGLLVISSVGIRLLDGRDDPACFLGLPASALLMGFGLVLLPLLLVGFGYAATCDLGEPAARPEVRKPVRER